jgi:cytochrome c
MLQDGPWKGQLLVSDSVHGGLRRLQFDPHASGVQGCVFRLAQGLGSQVDHVAMDSQGTIWVIGHEGDESFMHQIDLDSGEVLEIERVKAFSNGLEVMFSGAVDPAVAADPASWHLQASSLGQVGDSSRIQVKQVMLLPGGRRVFLEITDLPARSLLHLQLFGPWLAGSNDVLHSNECWYTMREVPTRRFTETARSFRPVHNSLTATQKAQGWKLLFDGESAEGWRGFRKQELPEGWSVIDGAIVRTGSGGDIITREQFDDFELSLDWKVQPGGNSGIFYNVTEDGGAVYSTGPEMQVLDNVGHADGGSPLTSAGANYALHSPAWDTTGPPGTWNRARIVMDGDRVEHWLNGVLLLEYVLNSPDWERRVADSKFNGMPDYGRRRSGHIALQDHGDVVAFRNLMIRRLDSSSGRSGDVD